MCGGTDCKIRNYDIRVILGYSGGTVSISEDGKEMILYHSGQIDESERMKLQEFLKSLDKNELIEMFTSMIDNAYEA